MASPIARNFAEQMLNTQYSQIMYGETPNPIVSTFSSETFTKSRSRESTQLANNGPTSTSSYTLASEGSQYSNDVDLWLRGGTSPTESTGVQNSRIAVVQRSTLAPTQSLDTNGIWYIVAMILPLFSVNNCMHWRCTPSGILNAAEVILTQLSSLCNQARIQVRRLAHDQAARDLFATAMDIVLVVYAIGFLVLSLYQASIIG